MENKVENRLSESRIELDIEKFQDKLVPLVQEMFSNDEICFTSDFYKPSEDGNNWLLKNDLSGNFIVDFYKEDPNWYVETSKKIADDYQKVVEKYFSVYGENIGNLFEEGEDNLFETLSKWSAPLVESELISLNDVNILKSEFEELVSKKKENLFGYVHGNIIGDHIYVDENKTLYLLGMRITSRAGKGYYDFLRSLDWIFLKSESDENNFNFIIDQMKQNTKDFDWEEVRLIFALRCVGILGWDMIHRGDYGAGDKNEKIKYLLRFINREY